MTTKKKKKTKDQPALAVGDVLERTYKDATHTVRVTEDGFKYQRKTYRSLTAIAKEITGYAAVSGPRWFGLTEPKGGAE